MWYYVYILQNEKGRLYKGVTKNLKKRLQKHNSGQVTSTASYLPWKIIYCSAFPDKQIAYTFEKYLKSGSGRAFIKKHLVG